MRVIQKGGEGLCARRGEGLFGVVGQGDTSVDTCAS